MSTNTDIIFDQAAQTGSCDAIELHIAPREHDLGGFIVRRALPCAKQRMVGPFIFFDHMGPAEFAPGEGVDVRPHPHINLATVTYLFEGEMFHRDSLGNALAITPGAINLMVAGKGIVHSERQREEVKAKGNRLNGLQLWLALPEADEETEPAFYHYDKNDIPEISVEGTPVRVLIGSAYGVSSPVKTFAQTLYIEASLPAGGSLTLPDAGDQRAVYVANGRLKVQGNVIDQHTMAVLRSGHSVTLQAEADTRFAVIGGEKLTRRHIWWNFVSSRKERIEQAKQDWRNGVFAKVPGDEQEFIPLPDQ